MKKFIVAGLSAIACTTRADAGLVNGGFESGFSGWSTLGFTSVETSAFGSGPTEGTQQALMRSGDGTTSATLADLDTFFGFAAGQLNSISTGRVEDGSAIKQTFTANAGNLLSFNWNFLTKESITAPDPAFNDFAFFSLNSTPTKLADLFSSFTTSSTAFTSETGFQTLSISLPVTGTYTLGFGVANVGDQFIDSGLLVDNVQLTATAVPEPSSLMLGCLGILLMLGYAWRLGHLG